MEANFLVKKGLIFGCIIWNFSLISLYQAEVFRAGMRFCFKSSGIRKKDHSNKTKIH